MDLATRKKLLEQKQAELAEQRRIAQAEEAEIARVQAEAQERLLAQSLSPTQRRLPQLFLACAVVALLVAVTAFFKGGPEGPVGPRGEQGIVGVQGERGPSGPAGPQGVQGPQGIQGQAGAQGVQGVAGAVGSPGPAGPQGVQGLRGDAGPMGPKGDKGDRGDAGAAGTAGSVSAASFPYPQLRTDTTTPSRGGYVVIYGSSFDTWGTPSLWIVTGSGTQASLVSPSLVSGMFAQQYTIPATLDSGPAIIKAIGGTGQVVATTGIYLR